MSLNINVLLIIVIGLIYVVIYLMIRTIINKFSSLDDIYKRNNKRLAYILSLVQYDFKPNLEALREIKTIKQNLILDKMEEKLQSKELLNVEKKEIKNLSSKSKLQRKKAATYLSLIGSKKARESLEAALRVETDYSTKIYISNALTDIRNAISLKYMVEAIINTHKWYREKAISNILEYGYEFQSYFEGYQTSKDIAIIELLIKYANENFNAKTKAYLFDFVDRYDEICKEVQSYYGKQTTSQSSYNAAYLQKDLEALLVLTCRGIANSYYTEFNAPRYYNHANFIIQTNALWALSKSNLTENFKIVLSFISHEAHHKTIISVLTKMVEVNPRFFYILEEAFESETNAVIKGGIAQVLSNKIEYYILKLNNKNDVRAEKIIAEIIKNKKINELIGFLNRNKDLDLENRLLQILSDTLGLDSETGRELRSYLKPEILRKWGVEPILITSEKRKIAKDTKQIAVVLMFTVGLIILFPLIFILRNYELLSSASLRMLMKQYVIDFNYYLVFYSIVVNTIYILLLFLSFRNVKRQAILWNLKNISMLFRNKMIPSISIIAPAFNEEKTIIESAKSLLNLKYPDYELIIVNDGSQDETLQRLIEVFKLVRVDYIYTESIMTKPIHGIYKNPSLPKLIVVDKSNGGKADSLNTGINIANKTYFCGIDADSLLETEALLKLASLTLDESTETPALGGNIFPINGCSVDKGYISKINIPKNTIARFQTIEYLRAFMAGRLGWQKLNSLLIISGAFGLFRKDRIVGIGGYLTEKGKYKKDTVGEDMELIVRISRMMHEMKHPFKILYSFNANCWTEVPEDLKSLRTQRFRWHRGLIDILFFHRKVLFNKNYGRTGLIAMPYFLIFEAFGPMIEIQGYLMVVLAAVLGILDIQIALMLFISTILLGIIVSIASLLIAEKETHYFSLKDLMILIFYALIENFGFRQLMSYWRTRGQLNIVFSNSSWGKIERKGTSK